MSVQRWDIDAVASPSEDGAFVTHEAHQSSLAEREQRIAKYKLALEKADYEFAYGLYEEAKKTVRAALAATEGEKRETK